MALLGTSPLMQLLSPEQQASTQESALTMGGLTALAQLLAASGPQARPVGSGQAIGQALLGGIGGYQSSMDKQLRDIATTVQLQDVVRKQKEAEQVRKVLASAATPTYSQEVVPEGQTLRDDQGMLTMGAQPRQLTGMEYDMKKVIPTLQALGRFDLIKDIAQSQQELRKSGIMAGDMANIPTPFNVYLNAESPNVRTLAKQYEDSFKRGFITEEQANRSLEALAKMEESYQGRVDARAKEAKPTEGEKNAAGFVQRMEFSEAKIKDIEGKVAQARLAGKDVGDPYATARTEFLGSLPLIGEYARGKGSSVQQQAYRQAQENWVRANLRKESGAAIGKEEMDREIATYFPMPADSPEVLAQKAQARQVTMNAMRTAAGNAYKPFDMKQFMRDNGLEPRK